MRKKKNSSTRVFMKEALRSIKTIGSLVPSSPALTRKMIAVIPLGFNGVIVEVGMGTGVFTKALLTKVGKDARIIAFEGSAPLVDFVKSTITDPRVTVVHAKAQTAAQYLQEHHISAVPYVISGLPLGSMKKEERQAIITVLYDILADTGVYVQFQYFLSSLVALKKKFKRVKVVHFELKNIPPAFVYECRKT